MRQRRVEEIILPYRTEVPLEPSVSVGDRIVDAVERMVSLELRVIAVMKNQKPIGVIRLEDAFHVLGLKTPSIAKRKPDAHM